MSIHVVVRLVSGYFLVHTTLGLRHHDMFSCYMFLFSGEGTQVVISLVGFTGIPWVQCILFYDSGVFLQPILALAHAWENPSTWWFEFKVPPMGSRTLELIDWGHTSVRFSGSNRPCISGRIDP